MEIKYSNVNSNMDTTQTKAQVSSTASNDAKFADELKEQAMQNEENSASTNARKTDVKQEEKIITNIDIQNVNKNQGDKILNQTVEKDGLEFKVIKKTTDNDVEGLSMINNDFNIENKNNLAQMSANMNFDSNGQPFSSFMNSEEEKKKQEALNVSAKELAEEAAILSSMAENIAIANKNNLADEPTDKVISNNEGVKRIDTNTRIIEEVIVRFDNIIMNESDVEVFADLVNGKDVNINNLSAESLHKSVNISKTLSDMLAKAMETNKPIRIEFDNGISVIIKISRDGKLSADFLPSTQVAEAYLKENLPLLKQKFNEQNIDYDELNQRERRNQNREQNSKKGRENE